MSYDYAFPSRPGYKLTEQAESDYSDWIRDYEGCTCFRCAPCSSCTHDGHPLCLENDDSAWELDQLDPNEAMIARDAIKPAAESAPIHHPEPALITGDDGIPCWVTHIVVYERGPVDMPNLSGVSI